jgi:HD-like signal output (HDOD) protein
VAQSLRDQDAPPTLVTAGLLHDIGKAVPGTSVRLVDRVAKVLLASIAPNQLALLAASQAPRWPLGGVWVLSRHARHGGELARRWGYPERVAWLVEHHEDRQVSDPQLALLMAVDDGSDERTLALGMPHE